LKMIDMVRVVRFCVVGGIAAVINLAVMYCFVTVMAFDTFVLRNIANVLSLVCGMSAAFILNRAWTWWDAKREAGTALVRQFLMFCSAATLGIALRIGSFGLIDYFWTISYLVNVTIGIGLAATIDFILYDHIVFIRGARDEV
jgi:putative flippase GtrA